MTTAPTSPTAERPAPRTRPPLPSQRAVLKEQVRTIGVALRTPMLVAAVLALLATLAIAIQLANGGLNGSPLTEPSATPGVIGALLPIAVWMREELFGPGFLWTLPVDRRRHALIKVLAGWLWLMAGVALYSLCLLVLALVSGGGSMPVETLHVMTAAVPISRSVPVDPATLRLVQWTPGPLIWAVPFGAATATYLLASAFMLAARRPLRWVAGALLLFPLASLVSHVSGRLLGMRWLADAPERALGALLDGRYGLDALLKLRTWTLDRRAFLSTGEAIEVWSAVPDLAGWRIAAVLWIGAGLLALWLAASRHRERRRR